MCETCGCGDPEIVPIEVQARILSDEPTTLESLGREMGVSKERVRQLEARALEAISLAKAATALPEAQRFARAMTGCAAARLARRVR